MLSLAEDALKCITRNSDSRLNLPVRLLVKLFLKGFLLTNLYVNSSTHLMFFRFHNPFDKIRFNVFLY